MNGAPEVLVVGGGNIGSRHVQGLARAARPLAITVVDPNPDSLKLAADRFAESPKGAGHSLALSASLDEAPPAADVCIVATPAGPRPRIVQQIARERRARFLILEKFLFQARADYGAAARALAEAGIPAWVNCPRPMWPSYRQARADIAGNGPVALHVVAGRAAALATNAIHFLDALDFLAGRGRTWTLRGDRLRKIEGGGRHAGAVEFAGALYGVSDRGDMFSFMLNDDGGPHHVDISAPGRRWIVREGAGKAGAASAETDWAWSEIDFAVPYQSAITGDAATALLDTGDCALPTLAESSALHLAMLDAYFEALGVAADAQTDKCPVT